MPRARKSAPKPRTKRSAKKQPAARRPRDRSSGNPEGRPSLFTPQRRAKILAALTEGAPYLHAAASARVSYRTFREWVVQGEKDEAAGLDTEFSQFSQDVRQAESTPMLDALRTLKRAGKKNWQAASTMLRMRYPAVFGRQVVDHREMSEAEAAKVLADVLGINEDSLPKAGEA